MTLKLAVPLWAYEAQQWTSRVRWAAIHRAGAVLACEGDQLMFGRATRPRYEIEFYRDADGTEKYRRVRRGYTGPGVVFNELARGLGALMVESPEQARRAIDLFSEGG